MTLRFFESAEEATSEVSDDDQDEPWTDQLSDFAVPVFASQPAINFDVPHDPLAVNFFFQLLLVMICGIILWPRLIAMWVMSTESKVRKLCITQGFTMGFTG